MARTTSKPSLFSLKGKWQSKLVLISENGKVAIVQREKTNKRELIEFRPKFLVGVMHVTKDPWLSITRDGQIPAWEKSNYKNFSVIYFFGFSNRITTRINSIIETMRWNRGRYASYGISYVLMFILRPWLGSLPNSKLVGERKSKVRADALRVRIPELTSTMRWKKLTFLKYFLEKSDAEYVIITTSSSLLNFEPIIEFLQNQESPEQPIYAGRICIGHDCEFTSGSFTIMNRQSASLLLKNRRFIPLHVMDDIGFGAAFQKIGIKPENISSEDLDSMNKLEEFSKGSLQRIGHFRFRSGPIDARGDAAIMRELILKLTN